MNHASVPGTPPGVDQALCGWRVRGDRLFPCTHPWDGDDRACEVEWQHVPPGRLLAEAGWTGPGLRRAGANTFGIIVHPQLGFRIEGGRAVTVEAGPAVRSADVQTFLFGSVARVLAHQRGLVWWPAAAVTRPDGGVLVICGAGGSGKTSVVLGLTVRGARLVADEGLWCDPDGRAVPSHAGIKVWRDTADALGLAVDSTRAIRPHSQKFHMTAPWLSTPQPVTGIVLLERDPWARDIEIRTLASVTAVTRLTDFLMSRDAVGPETPARRQVFGNIATLVPRVPVFVVRRPPVSDLAALISRLDREVP